MDSAFDLFDVDLAGFGLFTEIEVFGTGDFFDECFHK